MNAEELLPEGDTLAAIAAALHPKLVGRPLRDVWLRLADRQSRNRPFAPLRRAESLVGLHVRDVRSVGKHLLIDIPRGQGEQTQVLRVHLAMTGSWHRYAPGEPWKKAEDRAWVVLRTDEHVIVCFDPRVVEWTRGRGGTPPAIASLGPDLRDPSVDLDVVVARVRDQGEGTLADLLLDQRVACGLGNVYKSELAFLAGLHPDTPVDALSDDVLRTLYATARDLLLANHTVARVTTGDARQPLWVYDRTSQPCRRCATPIVSAVTGTSARRSYWCPSCQPPTAQAR